MQTHSDIRVTSKLYYYAAQVIDVYDGDTLTVNLDLGMGIWRNGLTIRLWKIDTPEVRGADRERGLQVRDMVRELVMNKSILLRTILDKRGEDRVGKYGRLLGEVLVPNPRGALINVNDLLLGLGMAVPMGSDGSRTRSLGPAGAATTAMDVPATVPCPFCGESRAVIMPTMMTADDAAAAEPPSDTEITDPMVVEPARFALFQVAQCPNCLDEARPLSELQ